MGRLNYKGAIVADDALSIGFADKSTLRSGNFVYVMAEPLGEPYYIGRIMEFVKISDPAKPDSDNASDLYQVRLNWLYRPADLHKSAKNTRELFLTMHADLCPLASVRGKCVVKHRAEIGSTAEFANYIKVPNNFWFDRLWDRYIERFFDVVPSKNLVSLPSDLREILSSRYQYVVLEPSKTKELTSGISQECKTCCEWATDEDSVTCARCDSTYHMACLDPPLTYKPPRGFGWSCAECTQAVEERFRDRQIVGNAVKSPTESSEQQTVESSIAEADSSDAAPVPTYIKIANAIAKHVDESKNSRQEAFWSFRYLGIHASIEDAFDADDRIHPRAASRIGSKHQALIKQWPGRPVIYYKRQIREGRMRGGRRGGRKPTKKDESPPGLDTSLPWVQEMPKGYLERGSDATSTLMWAPDVGNPDSFLEKTKVYAEKLSLHPTSPNFLDACLKAFHDSAGDEARALRIVATFTRKSLKEPTFSDEEVERFEEAVEQYGSELHDVYKHVGTQSSADIVRFYYMWKKTPGGHRVWDNCQARLSRRKTSKLNTEFISSIADTADPDITFSTEKIKKLQKAVECKHCHTRVSRKWKRASGRLPTENDDPIEALCLRCARLWYRYGIVWQDPQTVLEILSSKGAAKDKLEPELIEDSKSIVAERERGERLLKREEAQARKSQNDGNSDDDVLLSPNETSGSEAETKVEASEAANELESESPDEESEEEIEDDEEDDVDESIQNSYCVICCQRDPYMTCVQCMQCNIIVHRDCYSVEEDTMASHWLCDPCSNNVNTVSSINYQCALCPCESVSYIQWIQGESQGNPDILRFAEFGRWVHQRCAVWDPHVTFGIRDKRVVVNGVLEALEVKKEASCSICTSDIPANCCCDTCLKPLHAGCAGSKGYAMGFKINTQPAEGQVSVQFNGVTGVLENRIRCSDHAVDDLIPMSEVDEVTGLSILQLFIERYLQSERNYGASDRAQLVNKRRPAHEENLLAVPANAAISPLNRPLLVNKTSCATCGMSGAVFWYNITPRETADTIQLQCPRCFSGESTLREEASAPLSTIAQLSTAQMEHIVSGYIQ